MSLTQSPPRSLGFRKSLQEAMILCRNFQKLLPKGRASSQERRCFIWTPEGLEVSGPWRLREASSHIPGGVLTVKPPESVILKPVAVQN